MKHLFNYKVFFILIFFILSFLSASFCFAQQEQVTITTYYPAPYGVYFELRSQRMAIGDNYYQGSYQWTTTTPCPVGFSCIDNHADLVVEENVGIGTINPSSRLYVRGHSTDAYAMKLDSGMQWGTRLVFLNDYNDATGGTGNFAINVGGNTAERQNKLVFFSTANTAGDWGNTIMSFDKDGRVGIRTTGDISGPTAGDLHSDLDLRGTSNTCVSMPFLVDSGTTSCPLLTWIVYPPGTEPTTTSGYFICCRLCPDTKVGPSNRGDGVCD